MQLDTLLNIGRGALAAKRKAALDADGTYKVARHVKDYGRGDDWKYYVCEKDSIWTNDLTEALALAEEAYKVRNALLLECEKEKAALAEKRAAQAAKRAEMPIKTPAECLVDSLAAFIEDRVGAAS